MNYAVVIPCHNSGPQLVKTVRSALDQTLPPAEVLCIEDRSTDGTWETIQRLSRETSGRVKGFLKESGTGAGGRNLGILNSTADWVAFLDHDDLWFPEKMERQAALAGRSKFLCSALYEETDDDPATRVRIDRGRLLTCNDPFKVLFHRIAIVPCTVVIHRSALEAVGGFTRDPLLRWASDVEMWLRMARSGFEPVWHPEPLAIRRIHASNMSHNAAPGLRACLQMLETYRATDAEAVRRAGGQTAARRAIHWRRLELADVLLRAGETDAAGEEVARVRGEGWADPRLWRLWRKLRGRDLNEPRSRREIKRTYKALRRWCTSLLMDNAGAATN